jgi:hypothetical protein
MAMSKRIKASLVPALLAVGILIVVGTLLFSDLKISETEQTIKPPIEVIDSPLPLTVIESEINTIPSEQIIEKEAAIFIETLAKPQKESITINENQDQFVRHDSTIILPKLEQRVTTIEELLADPTITADTPITLHYTTDITEQTTLAKLSDNYEDQTVLLTIVDPQGESQIRPLFEYLNQENIVLTAPVTLLTQKKHRLQINAKELKTISTLDHNQPVIATINRGMQELSINKIVPPNELPEHALFYVHRVTKHDHQGLWGIIQAGLINKFREGVYIEGIASNKETVQAVIPADADEKLSSGLSSFLGKILSHKVSTSYIYNFSTHIMSHDPNQIYPGQQLIMIHFSPQELSKIYQFFSNERNQGIVVFTLSDQ